MSLFSRKKFLLQLCRGIRNLLRTPDVALEQVCDPLTKLPHTPVMVKEVVKNLNLKEGDLFLDMTFGAGGHSRALLKETPGLQVFALDRDPAALKFASELQDEFPGQIWPLTGKFSDLPNLLDNYHVKFNTFDGILFDLGCSSMQLDNAERGFSFSRDGPLDMRMGDGDLTAADLIAYIDEEDLTKVLKIYGGEKRAQRISRAIIQARARYKPLTTTKQLSDLVETVVGRSDRRDILNRTVSSATKVFQAIRIFINNEINELNYGLYLAHKYLKTGGRIAVLTFHSGEDLIVKRHLQNRLVDNRVKPLPLVYVNPCKDFTEEELTDFKIENWQGINKHVIAPTEEEINLNPRSRSAKLRVACKAGS